MAVQRMIEQFAKLVPRMLCALIAAGFIAKLLPGAFISRFLGTEAGLLSLVVAAVAGLIVPGQKQADAQLPVPQWTRTERGKRIRSHPKLEM